ncbi:MAG TPA: substrate-binding domain-containing protein [Roseiflexaceae bacterium]|nr:substrate-binding domain-containing protein [Roseiflexaceae bacterium]
MTQRRMIGVLAPYLTGPFFRPLIAGVHEQLSLAGYQTVIIKGTPRRIVETGLAADHIAGWVVCVATDGAAELLASGRPVVLVSAYDEQLACPGVVVDDFGGSYAATQHLLSHGHTRLAFLGDLGNYDIRQRHGGFEAALAAAQLGPEAAVLLESSGMNEQEGFRLTQRLLRQEPGVTAIVAATDLLARGAIGALRAAGRSVPEDIAVIGFDDLDEAQYNDPPLTTVRQRPAASGRTAVKLLLDQLEGGAGAAPMVQMPTVLMVRRSCGCLPASTVLLDGGARRYSGHGWPEQLALDLVRLALLPLPADQIELGEAGWPNVHDLVRAARAALEGGDPPPEAALEAACQQAVRLVHDTQALFDLVELLRRGVSQGSGVADPARLSALGGALALIQQQLVRAYMAQTANRIFRFNHLAMVGYGAMGRMFGVAGTRGLVWLESTDAHWGMLGLWPEGGPGLDRALSLGGAYRVDAERVPLAAPVTPSAFPPHAAELAAMHPGDLIKIIPIATTQREWGLLAYAEPLTDDDYDTTSLWSVQLGAVLERDDLLASMQRQQQTLRDSYQRELALAETVRQLGCPIIPILRGVLLVPLVGALDEQRAQRIIEQVLERIGQDHARHVLIDITGVPVVDTQVAAALIRTAQAAGLLGAHVTLVGVRPESAQSIVGLGIDLSRLSTRPTLEAALAELLRQERAPQDGQRLTP